MTSPRPACGPASKPRALPNVWSIYRLLFDHKVYCRRLNINYTRDPELHSRGICCRLIIRRADYCVRAPRGRSAVVLRRSLHNYVTVLSSLNRLLCNDDAARHVASNNAQTRMRRRYFRRYAFNSPVFCSDSFNISINTWRQNDVRFSSSYSGHDWWLHVLGMLYLASLSHAIWNSIVPYTSLHKRVHASQHVSHFCEYNLHCCYDLNLFYSTSH